MTPRRSEISRLRNLRGRSEEWLNDIGVFTLDDLKLLGSIEIYRLLRQRGINGTLNLVYAIEGALNDLDWRDLPPQLKAELKAAVKDL